MLRLDVQFQNQSHREEHSANQLLIELSSEPILINQHNPGIGVVLAISVTSLTSSKDSNTLRHSVVTFVDLMPSLVLKLCTEIFWEHFR